MLLRPAIFRSFADVRAAQSTRHGGVSQPPYASLNLGKSTDDHPDHVAENRRRFCAELGFGVADLAWSRQVHGPDIRVVDAPGGSEGYDALITDHAGILLSISVADCTPILVFDPQKRAIAAIHAGWRGTVAGIVERTLRRMGEQYGTRGADCYAYVGACISADEFEVGDEVAERFSPDFKKWNAERGKFFVDLKQANAAQLRVAGLPSAHIEVSPHCTIRHNADFFSHRAERGTTGRMAAAIGFLE
jgi:polyphenol oxidase